MIIKGKWEANHYMSPEDSWRIVDENGDTIVRTGRGEKAEANAKRICQCVNNFDKLLEACIKAHDNLLSLHICDQDRQKADNLRNEIKQAIAESED